VGRRGLDFGISVAPMVAVGTLLGFLLLDSHDKPCWTCNGNAIADLRIGLARAQWDHRKLAALSEHLTPDKRGLTPQPRA
jgi:hypothetical protein